MAKIDREKIVRAAVGYACLQGYKRTLKITQMKRRDIKSGDEA